MKPCSSRKWLVGIGLLAMLAVPACYSDAPAEDDPATVNGTETVLDLVAATRELKGQLAVRPGDPEVTEALANVYARRGLFGEAISTYKDLLADDPENAVAWHNLSLCYERQDLLREALAATEMAAELVPGNKFFQQELLRVKARQRDGESGERAFTAKLSKAYEALERTDPDGPTYAAALIDDLMRNWPEQSETWNVAGIMALRLEELTLAKERFDRAIARDPRALQARYNRALLAWREDDRGVAQAQFKAITNLLPEDDDRARAYVGRLLQDLAAGKSPAESRIEARERAF